MLRGGDSFQMEDETGISYKWDTSDTTFFQGGPTTPGPAGQAACFSVINVAGGYFNYSMAFDQQPVWIPGFWFRRDAVAAVQFLQFLSSSTAVGSFGIDQNGHFQLYSGGDPHQPHNGTVLGTATYTLGLGAWVFLEVAVNLSSGTFQVRLTELGSNTQQLIITGSGSFAPFSGANKIAFRSMQYTSGGGPGQPQYSIAGVRFLDGQGTNNTNMGSGTVIAYYATAQQIAQWVPNTGTAVTAANDHNTNPLPDGDVTYISPSGPNLTEAFSLQTVPCTGLILGIMTNICGRDPTGLGGNTQAIMVSRAQHNIGSPEPLPTTPYAVQQAISEVSPDTGSPWTAGEISQDWWGVLNDATTGQRVTQYYLEVVTLLDTSVPFSCGGVGSYSYSG